MAVHSITSRCKYISLSPTPTDTPDYFEADSNPNLASFLISIIKFNLSPKLNTLPSPYGITRLTIPTKCMQLNSGLKVQAQIILIKCRILIHTNTLRGPPSTTISSSLTSPAFPTSAIRTTTRSTTMSTISQTRMRRDSG